MKSTIEKRRAFCYLGIGGDPDAKETERASFSQDMGREIPVSHVFAGIVVLRFFPLCPHGGPGDRVQGLQRFPGL